MLKNYKKYTGIYRIALFSMLIGFSGCAGKNKEDSTIVAIAADSSIKEEEGALSFLIVGDWGRCGEFNQQEVGDQMDYYTGKSDAEFIISTGDNFYDKGVRSVSDPLWKDSFEEIYKGSNLRRDWFVVLGNHDYEGTPQAEVDYSKVSRRWNMPARYFTFTKEINDTSSVRFIFLDTSPFVKKYHKEKDKYADLARQDTAKQIRWLDSVLAASTERWKIVVGHHPVYSSSKKHGDTKELKEWLKPMLEKYKVQVYFAGHDHDLQHQKPSGSTVDYIVSGGGSENRPTGKYEHTKFAEGVSGFVLASLKADSMNLYFIDYKGNILYKTLIEK
jgi:tartrate-resistant acid phosphatase type 5